MNLKSVHGRASRLLLPTAIAASLSGCGTSTVESDPLTARLGQSSTAVQQVSDGFSLGSLKAAGGSTRYTDALNKLVGEMIEGKLTDHSLARIEYQLAHIDRAYGPAQRLMRKIRAMQTKLDQAVIPEPATSESSGEIQDFIRDYNKYVRVYQDAIGKILKLYNTGLSLRAPSVSFLRAGRKALINRDRALYMRARSKVIASFKTVGTATSDLSSLNSPDDRKRLDALVDDANQADDVNALIRGVVHRYPSSVFAKQMGRS